MLEHVPRIECDIGLCHIDWLIFISLLDFQDFKENYLVVTDTGSGIIGSWVALVLQYWSRVNGVTLVLSRMKNWKSWYWEAVKKTVKFGNNWPKLVKPTHPLNFIALGLYQLLVNQCLFSMTALNQERVEARHVQKFASMLIDKNAQRMNTTAVTLAVIFCTDIWN